MKLGKQHMMLLWFIGKRPLIIIQVMAVVSLWMVLQDFLPIYFVSRMKRKSILFIVSRYNGTPLPDGMIQVGN